MRISVELVLGLLAQGVPIEKILADYPDLELDLEERAKRGSREKFLAVLAKVPDGPPDPGDEL